MGALSGPEEIAAAWLAAIAASAVWFAAAQAQARSDLAGRWATQGFGSIVELRPCAAADATLCGQIVWLCP